MFCNFQFCTWEININPKTLGNLNWCLSQLNNLNLPQYMVAAVWVRLKEGIGMKMRNSDRIRHGACSCLQVKCVFSIHLAHMDETRAWKHTKKKTWTIDDLLLPLFSFKNIAHFDSLSVTSPSIDGTHFNKHPLQRNTTKLRLSYSNKI